MLARNQSEIRRKVPSRTRAEKPRLGAAVTEFAIMLPLIVMIVFGSIEMSNGIFMKQAMGLAAYEGARAAAKPGANTSDVTARVQDVLTARGISGQTVTVTPSIDSSTPRGTRVSVRVRAAATPFSMNPLNLLLNKNIERTVVMVRL
jgi:Flp pilus assembly protein TadG